VGNSNFKIMWLTVNRECNFRCKWCYAEGTKFKPEDNMSFEMAKSLIDLASDLGVESIIIIGGEPTYWEHLFQTIQYIHEKKISSILVTNGYLLSNDDFLAKIKASNLNSISISLKAANEEQHKEFTGTNTFSNVLRGIEEASKLENKEVSVSYVVSKLTVDNLKEVAKVSAKCGARSLHLDACAVNFENEEIKKGYALKPNEYVRTIVDNIDEMSDIMDGKFSAAQVTMGCIWPKETLKKFIKEGKVTTGSCQMVIESGIIFTNKGELIPCNHMHDYSFGKFGVDFNDAKSFLYFRNSDFVVDFFKKVKTYPKANCVNCSEHTDCIGGCPLQWLVFDPNKIKNEYEVF
jgi:radical SAM protein with 4Fe4S-binding SPASM domain